MNATDTQPVAGAPLVATAAPAPGAPCGLTASECRQCSALPLERRADFRASRLAASRARKAALPVLGAARPTSSLSHRDGRGAAALDPRGRRVGVDLERADGVPPGTERYFLTRREREAAAALSPSTLWALKEAAWKALRCDASVPFTALELRFDEDARLIALALDGSVHPARARVSSPWPGYVLAVVWLDESGGR